MGEAWQPWLEELRYSRNVGFSVQRNNIDAAASLANMVKTSFGPLGMGKLIIPPPPRLSTVSSDGFNLLTELELLHPGAKIVRQLAYSQAEIAGDGVLTVILLAGELLKKAKRLLEMRVHPTIIVSGYRTALKRCLEAIRELAMPVSLDDAETMKKILATSATTKSSGINAEKIADCAYQACSTILEYKDGRPVLEKWRIMVFKKAGSPLNEATLIRGTVFERALLHRLMPKRIEGARIALLRCGMEFRKSWEWRFPLKLNLNGPEGWRKLYAERMGLIKAQVDKIRQAGANVVVTLAGIDLPHAAMLAYHGIQAVIRVPDLGGIWRLALASGGSPVETIDDLTPDKLGYAEVAEERHVGYEYTPEKIWYKDKIFVVDGCRNPRSVTILILSSLQGLADQAARAANDAISVYEDILKDPRVVAGAGALEAELAVRLRRLASRHGGKEQMAILAFAEAMEGVVATLAENSGLKPTEILPGLKAAHAEGHNPWIGIDVSRKGVADALRLGILEPALVKEHALKAAFEAASLVLRIDEILRGPRGPFYTPGEIPGGPALGEKPFTRRRDASDLPDEVKKAMKKARYIRHPAWKGLPF